LARNLYATSLASVGQVTRIAHAVDEERQLVNDHIFENDPAAMAEIERRIAGVTTRLQQSEKAYASLIDLPLEAELWHQVQSLEAGFNRGIAEVLALSRVNQNTEARARMLAVQRKHMDLDSLFIDLTQLNLAGASEAMDRIGVLQQRTEAVRWGAGIAGLLILLLFGVWGSRRILNYEKQITGYALETEERNHDLDAFAGRVAHDLRNALGPLLMAPLTLRKLPGISDRAVEIADRIQRCSNRAVAVIDALLAFSRASRKGEANESAALEPAVRSVHDELAALAAQLEVSLKIAKMPDLHLRCNPGLLYIVLANLCGNAVKYLDGQKERRVHISALQEGSLCRIDVKDTGPGIAKDIQEKIFEPFFRVEGNQAPGTGIGLATVRRILDARGGRVAVQSDKGHGARFTVWLPIASHSEETPC
jgi:signal transduction histidine kinase